MSLAQITRPEPNNFYFYGAAFFAAGFFAVDFFATGFFAADFFAGFFATMLTPFPFSTKDVS